ncbi:gamma-interferon-responsive lysosomal thiol protein-like [Corylus avellana]|uniref:gamma-interferon-responsive lysosomal thiol protein-like n=1 Tax=Corylus avellana TaxID=13451 RepID=UPI00286A8823|nr:gamma-interferon-responsive lysosomal thiol protein-like [Corylus avellana]
MALLKSFSFIVLASLLFMLMSPSCSSAEHHGIKVPSPLKSQKANSSPVTLSLYYETLCPYCQAFIKNNLLKLFVEDLIDIVNLRFVPWGNARVLEPNKTIICQHGPDECYLNSIEACAINIWPDVKQHFKFIECVERQASEQKQLGEKTWNSCCQKLGLNPKPVSECYNSGHGRELILRYADETYHLNPTHKYVPWVVVNNVPLYDEYENFVSYVCKAYKGHLKLKACKSLPNKINLAGKANSIQPTHCNATEAKKMPVAASFMPAPL